MFISGKKYEIACDTFNIMNAKKVIVAMHGFAGSKKSPCIAALRNRIAHGETGLITFDWPAHGSSPVDGDFLRVENCLDDLNTVCNYVKENSNVEELYAFATSYGGYMALLFHYYHPDIFKKIILRSPAINMYDVTASTLINGPKENGNYVFGFERMLHIPKVFLDDLKQFDVNRLYTDFSITNEMMIIHGDMDDVAPTIDSVHFSQKHNVKLEIIQGADHSYGKPGQIDHVIDLAENFFIGSDLGLNIS